MELTFQKSADRWIAEFEAHADFAIHIEGVLEGNVQLLQRHPAHGMYAVVSDSIKRSSYVNVYDYEVPVLIAPVFIKVSCASEPTFAEVVSNGEVTEIKAQSKEIEVTSNGTMDITPDAGFAYLSAVKVKTNVAGSGGGSASSWRYWNVPESATTNPAMLSLLAFIHIYKIQTTDGIIISGSGSSYSGATILSMGIDLSQSVMIPSLGLGDKPVVIQEIFNMDQGGTTFEQMLVQMLGITEITEEQFYTL